MSEASNKEGWHVVLGTGQVGSTPDPSPPEPDRSHGHTPGREEPGGGRHLQPAPATGATDTGR